METLLSRLKKDLPLDIKEAFALCNEVSEFARVELGLRGFVEFKDKREARPSV